MAARADAPGDSSRPAHSTGSNRSTGCVPTRSRRPAARSARSNAGRGERRADQQVAPVGWPVRRAARRAGAGRRSTPQLGSLALIDAGDPGRGCDRGARRRGECGDGHDRQRVAEYGWHEHGWLLPVGSATKRPAGRGSRMTSVRPPRAAQAPFPVMHRPHRPHAPSPPTRSRRPSRCGRFRALGVRRRA
jgi:hypothetical protein